jgi:hypothetical protein
MKLNKWIAVLAACLVLAVGAPVSAQFGGLGALKKKLETAAKELEKPKTQPQPAARPAPPQAPTTATATQPTNSNASPLTDKEFSDLSEHSDNPNYLRKYEGRLVRVSGEISYFEGEYSIGTEESVSYWCKSVAGKLPSSGAVSVTGSMTAPYIEAGEDGSAVFLSSCRIADNQAKAPSGEPKSASLDRQISYRKADAGTERYNSSLEPWSFSKESMYGIARAKNGKRATLEFSSTGIAKLGGFEDDPSNFDVSLYLHKDVSINTEYFENVAQQSSDDAVWDGHPDVTFSFDTGVNVILKSRTIISSGQSSIAFHAHSMEEAQNILSLVNAFSAASSVEITVAGTNISENFDLRGSSKALATFKGGLTTATTR